jgi:hypothetical protein
VLLCFLKCFHRYQQRPRNGDKKWSGREEGDDGDGGAEASLATLINERARAELAQYRIIDQVI